MQLQTRAGTISVMSYRPSLLWFESRLKCSIIPSSTVRKKKKKRDIYLEEVPKICCLLERDTVVQINIF